MFRFNPTTRTLSATVASAMCAALLTAAAIAAPAKLQTIDVTPTARTISVGQKQAFTATGTFSDGSKQVLWPAISNFATGEAGGTCALLTSGGVECWGVSWFGQLGNGSVGGGSDIPVYVKGIGTATAVSSGWQHICALLAGGTIKCWGDGEDGQLGWGWTLSSSLPVSVTGISTATALGGGVGALHSCAVLRGGAVKCWGNNYSGQLGNGSYSYWGLPTPVSVIGISTATALGLGEAHTCALLASGGVQCWGNNYYGQLGNRTTTINSNTPVTVSGITSATAIASGYWSNCALLASGAIKCWGYNEFGELGNGSNTGSTTPVRVTGISTAIAITVGNMNACAVLRSGSVKCWGLNVYGQLGNGTTKNSNIPVTVSGIYAPTKLAAGDGHTCALFSGGMMRCWGSNFTGELGNGQESQDPTPLPVTVVGTPGVLWKSSNPTKATINDRGIATGRAAGNTTITATTPGFINDNAVLTVK